jgi:hypothetical protein
MSARLRGPDVELPIDDVGSVCCAASPARRGRPG